MRFSKDSWGLRVGYGSWAPAVLGFFSVVEEST